MRAIPRKPLALASAGTTLALAAAGGGIALATAPSGETVTPLARGALVKPANVNRKVTGGRVRIKTDGALDALMAQVILAPGGTTGWHSNTGPVINIVKKGTLTIIDANCKRHDIPAGHAAISPGSTDKLENLSGKPVAFNVTFLLPHGVKPDIDAPPPAGCTT